MDVYIIDKHNTILGNDYSSGHNKVFDIEKLKSLMYLQNTDTLTFKNMTVKYEREGKKQYFILDTEDDIDGIRAYISEDSVHPLYKMYGNKGLKLSKVVYTEKVENRANVLICFVDYVVFNVVQNDIITGELKLTAKELFKYLIVKENNPILNNGWAKSFLINSGLINFQLSAGLPEFYCKRYDYEDQLKNRYHYELAKSTRDYNSIRNWTNKLQMISTEQLQYNKSKLIKCSITTLDRISIPDFEIVNPYAFNQSTIKEIRITSPETIVLPLDKVSEKILVYTNKFNEPINIIKGYDDSREKSIFPYELNPFQQAFIFYRLRNYENHMDRFIKNVKFEI